MKLTGIAIDGYRALNNVRLMQISPSMNLVYGEKGAGKTRIADFIGGVLFGQTNSGIGANEPRHGSLEISHTTGQFSLTRDPHGNQLKLTSLTGANSSGEINQIAGALDAGVYENFFNVSFDTRATTAAGQTGNRLADALQQRLNVPTGSQSAGEATLSQQQMQAVASLRLEIETLNNSTHPLKQRSTQLTSQIAATHASVSTTAQHSLAFEQQISEIEQRIATLTFNPHAQELTLIAHEIQQLQHTINTSVPTYAPAPVPQTNDAQVLYELLDEVDLQFRHWQRLQNEVQQQRVGLREEMLQWNQLALDNIQHPYHTARKVLLNLEGRVDQAHSQSMQWLDSHGPIDSHQAAGFVDDVSRGIRNDLHALCEDLGKQYKNIRHRAAVAELKRMRNYYNEISENVTRLSQRRLAVIERIRATDATGADAIIRADDNFILLASQQGYLKARERFLGPITTTATVTQMVAPDLSRERSRLMVLESRRVELQNQGSNNSLELTQLRAREANLRNERNSLATPDDSQLKRELAIVDAELQRALATLQSLNARLAEAGRIATVTPDPILTAAGILLTRLSHGELTRVWLENGSTGVELQVQDSHDRVLNLSALSATLRSQTQLSLVLAACQTLAASGVVAPIVIDELFQDFDSDRIDTALQCLSEFARQGHQILMLTQHRFLIDRANNHGPVQFFDIETPAIATIPQTIPPAVFPPATATTYIPPVAVTQPPVTGPVFPLVTAPMTAPIAAHTAPATLAFTDARKNVPAAPTPRYSDSSSGTIRFQPTPAPVASIKASQIGDRLEYAVTFEEHSKLINIPIFDSIQLRTLNDSDIHTVADLLNIDLDQLPRQWAETGLTATVIENMQSEVWLLTCVPALRPYDAHVLVACGIAEPDQLETSAPQTLHERVQRYLNANAAEHDFDKDYQITISRINDWHEGISKTRNRWRSGRSQRGQRTDRTQRSQRSQRQTQNSTHTAYQNGRPEFERTSRESRYTNNGQQHDHDHNHNGRAERNYQERDNQRDSNSRRDYGDRDYAERNGERSGERNSVRNSDQNGRDRQNGLADGIIEADRSSSRSRRSRESNASRPPRMTTPTPETIRRSVPAIAPEAIAEKETKPAAVRSSPQPTKSNLKFYLDLEDHVEAAPSIGPKTAERFEKIGVFTISDFLKQTADSMADRLNYKRMSAKVVRGWQQQARLVCRIPNLRGHDAQLLVACEVIEPEEIATMQPHYLFNVIGPFSDTKEGLKIIRSGKKPDLAEITDWIAWAQHTRSLQAA